MNRIKAMFLFLFTVFFVGANSSAYAQQEVTVQDDMEWVNTIQQVGGNFSAQSPNLSGCGLTYTITSPGNGCGFVANNFVPGGGIAMPANHNQCADNQVTYTITFSQPVTNLRIHVSDVDEMLPAGNVGPSENLEFNAPFPVSTSNPAFGGIYLQPGNIVNSVDGTAALNDNAQGWIDWGSQIVTAVSFTYNRPAQGYVLMLDDMEMTLESNSIVSVVPVNETGYVTMDSFYGPIEVARFCEDDVIVDGSATENETDYYLTLASIDLATWTTTGIYGGWISGQAPNWIDVRNNVLASGVNLVPGTVYVLGLNTGPCWLSDNLFFVVEECCKKDIALEVDCENNLVYIVDAPTTAVTAQTIWSFSDGFTSYLIESSNSVIPNVPMDFGAGTYTVWITYTLPNGMECQYNQSIEVSKDYCCKKYGPQFGASEPLSVEGYEVVNTIPWGPLSLPIVRCTGFRTLMDFKCFDVNPTSVYVGIQYFDPVTWTGGSYVVTVANYSSPSYPYISTSNLTSFVANQWYVMQICAPGANCEYIVFKTDANCGQKIASNEEEILSTQMDFHPNPVTDVATVCFNESVSGELIIRSLEGKVLQSMQISEQACLDLEVKNFPSGMYFVEFSNSTMHLSKRFIKD